MCHETSEISLHVSTAPRVVVERRDLQLIRDTFG